MLWYGVIIVFRGIKYQGTMERAVLSTEIRYTGKRSVIDTALLRKRDRIGTATEFPSDVPVYFRISEKCSTKFLVLYLLAIVFLFACLDRGISPRLLSCCGG